jgi:hypothetical protein
MYINICILPITVYPFTIYPFPDVHCGHVRQEWTYIKDDERLWKRVGCGEVAATIGIVVAMQVLVLAPSG